MHIICMYVYIKYSNKIQKVFTQIYLTCNWDSQNHCNRRVLLTLRKSSLTIRFSFVSPFNEWVIVFAVIYGGTRCSYYYTLTHSKVINKILLETVSAHLKLCFRYFLNFVVGISSHHPRYLIKWRISKKSDSFWNYLKNRFKSNEFKTKTKKDLFGNWCFCP